MSIMNNRNLQIAEGSNTLIPSIHEDIIALILARLPVKPLLKFKCVSKLWHSLISSNYFAKAHLEISTKGIDITNYSFIGENRKLYALFLIPKQTSYAFNDCILHSCCSSVYFVGCCNGLCCNLVWEEGIKFFLWNPSTGKSMIYPKLEHKDTKRSFSIWYHGLGFDKSKDEYKVFDCRITREDDNYESTVFLYSLKSNSMKTIASPLKGGVSRGSSLVGTFVNGKLHWVTRQEGTIVCFDMETEMFGFVEPPAGLDLGDSPVLGVIDGCLSVLCTDGRISDVWVLKRKCWGKVTTVPNCKPLCITPKGECVYLQGKSVYYHDDLREDDDPQLIGTPLSFHQLVACVQTLVSPCL